MEKEAIVRKLLSGWMSFIRKCMFRVVRVGPIPCHIAVIMDGNRRYAKKKKLEEGAGHDAGALALLYLLVYCYELGVKRLTVYVFSLDNFKRKPTEVQKIMDLVRECIPLLTRIAKHRPLRVHFAGNLLLLSEDIRVAAKKLMEATANNSEFAFTLCVAYSSTDEIMRVVQESCKEKLLQLRGHDIAASNGLQCVEINGDSGDEEVIKVVDIEKHMYKGIGADPDILIRTGGEKRLSNFLLWQTCSTYLTSPSTLWPEIGIWHLVRVVLNYQRKQTYFEKKKNASVNLANGSFFSSSPSSN